jgi:hypothetical protein
MTAPAGTGPAAPSVARRRRRDRPGRAARRVGYVFAAAFNAVFLWLLHVWPGWDVVPFLTSDFADVLWLIDLSLWVGVGVNLVYLVRDPRWLTALGGLATTGVGLAAAVRLWQVFPFDVSDGWTVVFRVALAVGIVGSAIGILVNSVTFVRALAVGDEERHG